MQNFSWRCKLTLSRLISVLSYIIIMSGVTYSQEPYGDPAWRKQGIMDGNLVRTIFLNHGEVALWPFQPSGEWPKGSGHSYIDGVAMWMAAEVVDIFGKTIHPLETNYREDVDRDPATGVVWGWQRLPGYVNLDQTSPPPSNDPNTWPALSPHPPDRNDHTPGATARPRRQFSAASGGSFASSP